MSNNVIFKKDKNSNKNLQISPYKNKSQINTIHKLDQKNWIGDLNNTANTQIQDPRYLTQYSRMSQLSPGKISKISRYSDYKSMSDVSKINKSPTQLVQDILKGLNNNKNMQINPYYSKHSQQRIIELLSNKRKMHEYIKDLQQLMPDLDSDIVKNYQILILLLRQISINDVQIKQNQQGIQLKFNKNTIQRQQFQIQILQKELHDKQKQLKQIVEEYNGIIKNFNDVIGNLIQNKNQSKIKDKFNYNK